jgi:arsenate reductase (thioredoxin)
MMRRILPLLVSGIAVLNSGKSVDAAELFPGVAEYVQARINEFDQIPASRMDQLDQISQYIRDKTSQGETIKLTFVCTHNSRRSQFAQVWAAVAAAYYGVADLETFSGGTEVTAMNYRCADALRRCGLEISSDDENADNPRYQVKFGPEVDALGCFSKHHASAPNPTAGYGAVMTCSQADESCPTVSGCDYRVALTYDDPKAADGLPEESDVYDERSWQIAREMLYLMSRVRD